jgi:hypothetical protein
MEAIVITFLSASVIILFVILNRIFKRIRMIKSDVISLYQNLVKIFNERNNVVDVEMIRILSLMPKKNTRIKQKSQSNVSPTFKKNEK